MVPFLRPRLTKKHEIKKNKSIPMNCVYIYRYIEVHCVTYVSRLLTLRFWCMVYSIELLHWFTYVGYVLTLCSCLNVVHNRNTKSLKQICREISSVPEPPSTAHLGRDQHVAFSWGKTDTNKNNSETPTMNSQKLGRYQEWLVLCGMQYLQVRQPKRATFWWM